jgi:poly-beta-1,6-N-acetyl-D-glucosamine synthase
MWAIIPVFFAILYLIIISMLTLGWKKTAIMPIQNSYTPFVSVIIAARNEESSIGKLLWDLKHQDYGNDKFEVIIVNDHSSDHTDTLLRNFISKEKLSHFHIIDNSLTGKKAALDLGITKATGEIVLLTDADCTMGPSWISNMVAGFQDKQVQMLLGPVKIISKNDSWFEDFQTLEFMSLIGSTAGAASLNRPIMCNGANLGFYRQIYFELKNELRGKDNVSGDDVFLMFALKKARPGSIKFAMNSLAVVTTFAMSAISEFFHQRVRWASKTKNYDDPFALFTGAVVGGFNLILVILTFSMVFNGTLRIILIIAMWSVKFIADLPLLYCASRFFNNTKVLKYYPLLQIVYPFYVSLTLLLSIILPFKWKDRKGI